MYNILQGVEEESRVRMSGWRSGEERRGAVEIVFYLLVQVHLFSIFEVGRKLFVLTKQLSLCNEILVTSRAYLFVLLPILPLTFCIAVVHVVHPKRAFLSSLAEGF